MSISSMTNVAVGRRNDDLGVGAGDVPRGVDATSRAAAPKPEAESVGSTALKAIATYIPTEVITLYVAALAAVRAGGSNTGSAAASRGELATFYAFIAMTPIVVWLVYAGKVKTAGKAVPWSPVKWPAWEMVAAPLSFAAWAWALPDSPFTRFGWYTEALGTFIVLVTSTALGLLAPVVVRKLKA